jgi:hypothetical protein
MQQTLLIAGLACLIAAIVGGGLKAFGIEIPVLSSRFRQAVLGLLGLILIVVASLPGPTPSPTETPPANGQGHFVGGTVNVRCTAQPHAIPAGGQVEIRVLALTEQDRPLADANIRIETGGGWFSASGTATEVGQTNVDGVFMTQWQAPQPAAAAYAMSVRVTREGFTEGQAECYVPIQ